MNILIGDPNKKINFDAGIENNTYYAPLHNTLLNLAYIIKPLDVAIIHEDLSHVNNVWGPIDILTFKADKIFYVSTEDLRFLSHPHPSIEIIHESEIQKIITYITPTF